MSQRLQSKLEFYAQLLQKLHIINEQEKNEMLKQVEKRKVFM